MVVCGEQKFLWLVFRLILKENNLSWEPQIQYIRVLKMKKVGQGINLESSVHDYPQKVQTSNCLNNPKPIDPRQSHLIVGDFLVGKLYA